MDENKIVLTAEDGEEIVCYVLEETRIAGIDYVLAADSEEDDGDCFILKDISKPEDTEAVYDFVEDDDELQYLLKIFEELMEDVDFEF